MYNQTNSFEGDKAGYNQAGKITEILATLRIAFLTSIMNNNFRDSLEAIRGVLNVVSGKVKQEDINKLNEDIYFIEDKFEETEKTYNYGNRIYYTNAKTRTEVKKMLENLYRQLEKLQDKYGYGMVSQDDPRFAVLQR